MPGRPLNYSHSALPLIEKGMPGGGGGPVVVEKPTKPEAKGTDKKPAEKPATTPPMSAGGHEPSPTPA